MIQPKQHRRRLASQRRRRCAFTLVELLAASTLAVVLFVLLGGVMRSIARQDRWTRTQAEQHPTQWLLQQRIALDLANARHVRVGANRITLFGGLAQNLSTNQPLQQDAQVTYSIVTVGGKPSLVMLRVQKRTDGGQLRLRRVLWHGAALLRTEIFNELDEEEVEPSDEDDPTLERIPGMHPMPTRLELVVLDQKGYRLLRHNEVR